MYKAEDYLPQKLEGKKILISGGTTGIGRATAILLATLGAEIMLFGRHQKELDDTLEDISKIENASVFGIIADQSTKEGSQKIFEAVDTKLGGLDILINNAAIAYQSVVEGSFDDLQYALNSNLMGYLACTNEAVKRMKEKGGHIVNIGSMSAESNEKGSSVYVATKAGIRGFSASLRKELNPMGIKVSLVEPGAVATDMQGNDAEKLQKKVDANEMLQSEDIAVSIVYCLSQPKRCDVVTLQIRPHLQEI